MLTTYKPLIFPNFSKSYNCTQTTSLRTPYRSRRLFFKSHLSFILLRLLSELNPLRWASIWFLLQLRVSFLSTLPTSPRTTYRSRRLFGKSHFSLILSRLLSEFEPAALCFDSVFYYSSGYLFCQHNPC